MLCPCCGIDISPGARECSCGARFVGNPLDQPPIQIQRFGPVMNAGLLLVSVTGAALIFTKWIGFAAVVVLWASWRAVHLARKHPDLYGGYRTAVATFAVTVAASAVAAAYTIDYIPRFLENRELRQQAATSAACHHMRGLLEDYKRKYGSYPANIQALVEAINEPLPKDYWGRSISYRSYTEAIVDTSVARTGIAIANFELRSAGPDEKIGTDDDIIMRDGVFISPEEDKKPVITSSGAR